MLRFPTDGSSRIYSHLLRLSTGVFFLRSVRGPAFRFCLAAAIRLWRLSSRNRFCLSILPASWACTLLLINRNGFSPAANAYFVAIPAVIFLVSWWLPSTDVSQRNSRFFKCLPFLPLVLPACLWGFAVDEHPFLNLRDHLLFRNPVGIKLNTFYYNNSFYPAEAIKPLDQRILKTCNLDRISRPIKMSIERALRFARLPEH